MVNRLRFRVRRGEGEAGFTLLEMLVAVAILAALAAIIPRSFVSARAIVDRSDAWFEAQLVADAVLKDDLAGATLKPGILRGRKSGRDWAATITPDTDLHVDIPEDRSVLLRVQLRVAVYGTRSLAVDTMRIGMMQ